MEKALLAVYNVGHKQQRAGTSIWKICKDYKYLMVEARKTLIFFTDECSRPCINTFLS